MQNKLAVTLAAIMMAVPALGLAAMAGSNTVNSAAIVDGAVATADIANKAVTAAKLADATITATQLASGAVTDAKISGTIAVSKLPVGTTSTTVAAGNHTHSGAVKYAQVIVVAKSGGDSTNPASALNSITDASASKPYLVRVMPGVYDIGSGSVVMKPYVELEGSGTENTIITSTIKNVDWDTCAVGTVTMANNTSIRNIKVINTAPDVTNSYLFAGIAFNNVKGSVEGAKVYVGADTGLSGRNAGICYAGAAADVFVNDVFSEAHGYGNTSGIINRDGGKATVVNSRMLAVVHGDDTARGVNCAGSDASITVVNSLIEGHLIQDIGDFEVLNLCGCAGTVSNSKVRAISDFSSARGVATNICGDYATSIVNSEIYAGEGVQGIYSTNAVTQIANTLIQKGISYVDPATLLFNNYDEKFRPIPNQSQP
jgi:hypothetical protein